MGIGGTLGFPQVWGDHRRLETGEAGDLLRVDDDHLIGDDDGIASGVRFSDAF